MKEMAASYKKLTFGMKVLKYIYLIFVLIMLALWIGSYLCTLNGYSFAASLFQNLFCGMGTGLIIMIYTNIKAKYDKILDIINNVLVNIELLPVIATELTKHDLDDPEDGSTVEENLWYLYKQILKDIEIKLVNAKSLSDKNNISIFNDMEKLFVDFQDINSDVNKFHWVNVSGEYSNMSTAILEDYDNNYVDKDKLAEWATKIKELDEMIERYNATVTEQKKGTKEYLLTVGWRTI